jgi:hypothetical protein
VKIGKRKMNHNKFDEWICSVPTRDEVERWMRKQQLDRN